MSTYQVGDTVYGDFSYYGRIDVKQGTVVKVTPTGRVNVDFNEAYAGNGKAFTRQFDPKGWEIGGDKWHPRYLIGAETYASLIRKQLQQQALSRLNTHLRSASIESKAELDAFMEKLAPLVAAVGDDQ